MKAQVILVDENDNEIGVMEKLMAHKLGLLHRAISVFIFNSKGELLLQQRSINKYHSRGLWTNTACSHPAPGESVNHAAQRRLKEEMSLEAELDFCFKFIYKVQFSNGLFENEMDYVFVGFSDETPKPDPNEVADFRWISEEELKQQIKEQPEEFTEWFKLCSQRVFNDCKQKR